MINKLPRRTAQQVPAHRPGITTGFSQARSCHTMELSCCNQPHEAYNPVGIHQMAPDVWRMSFKTFIYWFENTANSTGLWSEYLVESPGKLVVVGLCPTTILADGGLLLLDSAVTVTGLRNVAVKAPGKWKEFLYLVTLYQLWLIC